MGKQGPCCHCGIATTPLWRNGPADKPVLCNACGSRWRTKGTLVNYMPMHSGGLGLKNSSLKKNTCKINGHSLKRKEPSDGLSDSYYSYQRSLPVWGILNEDDACTRSSSGSGMSVSESCAQRPTSSGRASDCWPPWGFHVPSKRRSVMHRHWTASNRFPCFYPSSELCVNRSQPDEELLVEYRSPSMSVEIGLGGVLIRSPTSGTCAQESQASSMMYEKQAIIKHSVNLESDLRKAYTLGAPFSEGIGKQKGKDRTKQFTRSTRAGGNGSTRNLGPNKSLLDNFPYKKRDVLQSCHSPLVFVELKDIINSDTFMSLLTEQEQHQLIKHLSPVDKPDSLKQMFSSAPFESALRGFQDLLSAGMFDAQESGVSTRVLQHYQHLLTTYDLTRSGWIERCSQMRKRKSSADYAKIIQEKEFLEEKLKALNNLGADGLSSSGQLVIEKFIPTSNFGSVVTEVDETPDSSIPSTRCQTFTPMSHATLDRADQPAEPPSRRRNSFKAHGLEGDSRLKAIQSPKTYQGRKSLMEAPSYGLLEHDVLLDVPSNLSFQQAELLHEPVFYKSPQPKDAGNLVSQSSKTSNAPIQDNVWPNEPNMDWSEFLWNSPSAGSVNDTF